MTIQYPTVLSDSELLVEIVRAADAERRSTANLLALLAELDRRKLYLCRGYPSLFAYCTRALHLSEPAAYSRITAARAARQFPIIFKLLADGDVTLTTVTLLSPHLTADNHEALLAAARHKGKREVERLVAIVDPQPAVPSSVRRLPAHPDPVTRPTILDTAPAVRSAAQVLTSEQVLPASVRVPPSAVQIAPADSDNNPQPRPPRTLGVEPVRPAVRMLSHGHAAISPIDADRYVLKITISGETRAKLDHARDLLRHAVPDGDPAAIVDRALSALLEKLQKSKFAAAPRPSPRPPRPNPSPRPTSREVSPDGGFPRRSRHVSAAVKRAVWARDGGRCAFIGTDGRCAETGFLEFHHVIPFAAGGPATVENLELRCRAHNGFEADGFFGAATVARRRSRQRAPRTLSGQSSVPGVESSG